MGLSQLLSFYWFDVFLSWVFPGKSKFPKPRCCLLLFLLSSTLKVYHHHHHHHHHHKIELARYSMTRSFHLSLSSIAISSYSSLHPEGLFNGIFINLIIFLLHSMGLSQLLSLYWFHVLLSWVFPGKSKFPQTLLLITVVSISIWL